MFTFPHPTQFSYFLLSHQSLRNLHHSFIHTFFHFLYRSLLRSVAVIHSTLFYRFVPVLRTLSAAFSHTLPLRFSFSSLYNFRNGHFASTLKQTKAPHFYLHYVARLIELHIFVDILNFKLNLKLSSSYPFVNIIFIKKKTDPSFPISFLQTSLPSSINPSLAAAVPISVNSPWQATYHITYHNITLYNIILASSLPTRCAIPSHSVCLIKLQR